MVGYKFVVRMKIKLFIVSCFFIQFAWGGVITTSITSLPTFGNVYVLNSSTAIKYTVSATALASGLTITAPAGFEISTQYLQGYTSVITLLPNAGSIPTTNIYARFSPSITGAMSGNITHVNIGSPTQNISVQGTGIAWAIAAGYYSTVSTQRDAALKSI